jgi:hypothetical protein
MPRTRKAPDDPSARIHGVTVLFDKAEYALVLRVAKAYGISKGAAVRIMMLAGADTHDPYSAPAIDQ